MPKVTTVLHPEEIIGQQHPNLTHNPVHGRLDEVVITTPYFLYTATMTRDGTTPYAMTRVDISVEDLP